MNLRCFYCQTPFTLSTDEKVAALRKMHAEDLHHYDAHCPRCGRANPVSRERLEMFTPGWEAAIKAPMAMGAAGGSMPAAPASSFSSTPAPMMERVRTKDRARPGHEGTCGAFPAETRPGGQESRPESRRPEAQSCRQEGCCQAEEEDRCQGQTQEIRRQIEG